MPRFLADTSAWNRSEATPEIDQRWSGLLEHDELVLCPPVELELLYSARGPADYQARRYELSGLPLLPLDEQAVAVAFRTQALLVRRSQHRGPAPIDLLIAAIAQIGGATLLHYDRHFDAIARVTRQPAEWLAPPGSLD